MITKKEAQTSTNKHTTPVILAIDGATHTSGYAIYKEGKVIAHGVEKHDKTGDDMTTRLSNFSIWMEKLIYDNQVTLVVVEDVYENKYKRGGCGRFGKAISGRTAYNLLMQLQGIYHSECGRAGLPSPVFMDALKVKKTFGIRPYELGRDQQKAMMVAAIQSLGYKLTTNRNGKPYDDEADAIAILLTYLRWHTNYSFTHPKQEARD